MSLRCARMGAARRLCVPAWCFVTALAFFVFCAPSWAQAPRFDILEYRVEGNTVLKAELIERAVYPFLGEGRGADDVENARAALELVYRNAGYGTVAVDTPEQRVTDGVVVLQVREAPIARTRVTGARWFSQQRVLDKVPTAAEGTVPNFQQLSEELASVNRSADRRVTPLLRPGKEPGTTELDLAVEDRAPLHGSLELNNRHARNTTPTRLQAAIRYENLWQREHGIGVQWQVSPEDTGEVNVIAGSYTVPVGSDLLVLTALRSDSTVAAGVGSTVVFGQGSVVGLRWVRLLGGDASFFHTLTLGVDHKDFDENVAIGFGSEEQSGFSTPVRYLPLSAAYSATLNDDAGRWTVGAGLNWAVRGLVSREQQFEDKRFGARGNFLVLKADLAREHKLPLGLAVFGKLEGQIADQPLIGNEQFVAGGAGSVRGYLEAAAVGDNALRGSLELRSPMWLAKRWPWLQDMQALAFVDGAWLALRDPLPGQASSSRLLGAGFGLKARLGSEASLRGALSLEVAWPLRALPSQEKNEPRLHATGSIEF
jgi:hemolysin activation/secretion protein